MRYLRILVLFALLPQVAAEAATLHLQKGEGVWAAALRACEGKVSTRRCAHLLPLILADNSISREGLRTLPVGRKIVISERYLTASFSVSPATINEAKKIFTEGDERSQDKEQISALQARISELENRQTELQSKIDRTEETAENATKERDELQSKLLRAEQELNQRAIYDASNPVWKRILEYLFAVLAASVLIALLLYSHFRHRFLRLKNDYRMLPLEAEAFDLQDRPHYFRLEDNNTYTCLDCERDMQATGYSGREKGKRLKLENLEHHLQQTREHAELGVAV